MSDFDDDLDTEAAIQAETRCGSANFDANTRVRNKIKIVSQTTRTVMGGRMDHDDDDDDDDGCVSKFMQASTDSKKENDSAFSDAPPERKLCRDCGTASYSVTFLKAFGLVVCNACMMESYPLITKSTAKDDFLCTDTELSKLRFMEKKNPQKPTWAPMKLFLKTEIEALAKKKYEDDEGLEQEKSSRRVKQLEKRLKKRKKERQKEAGLHKTKRVKALPPSTAHVHTFETDTNGTDKCTGCGFEVEGYEEL
jgi:DNA-repair protein complementing XP-A cells